MRARFSHFVHEACIGTREEDRLTFSEATMLRLLLWHADAIVRRCRRKLDRDWPTFAQDQGADPFGSHARIELHIEKTSLFKGSWTMHVYWNPENDDWAGVHLALDFAFVWPLFCDPVF